ncbi:hypothetical protein TNCV_3659261 [Trichonephila clavipes]|nr:hypothetical protein TNCV_3659261 [Trichonephila clavipes]
MVNFIQIQRIKWTGHVVRMDEDRTTKRKSSMPNQLAHGEKAGQILDGLMILKKNLLVLRTKNWRTLAGKRMAWKRLLEKAKAHPGLSSYGGRKENQWHNGEY